jgi:hypothetical protein
MDSPANKMDHALEDVISTSSTKGQTVFGEHCRKSGGFEAETRGLIDHGHNTRSATKIKISLIGPICLIRPIFCKKNSCFCGTGTSKRPVALPEETSVD